MATRLPVGGITGHFLSARPGTARRGEARRGEARHGNTPTGGRYHQLISLGATGQGGAGQGSAWRGEAWRGMATRLPMSGIIGQFSVNFGQK